MKLTPHLYFKAGCEQALEHYVACGLGTLRVLQKAGSGHVQHAELEGPGVRLYAGDTDDAEPMKGCALLLERTDVDAARTLFDALSAGGRVTVAFAYQPWGWYGNFTDRFGVQWAVLVRD
jgi:PhnB protein